MKYNRYIPHTALPVGQIRKRIPRLALAVRRVRLGCIVLRRRDSRSNRQRDPGAESRVTRRCGRSRNRVSGSRCKRAKHAAGLVHTLRLQLLKGRLRGLRRIEKGHGVLPRFRRALLRLLSGEEILQRGRGEEVEWQADRGRRSGPRRGCSCRESFVAESVEVTVIRKRVERDEIRRLVLWVETGEQDQQVSLTL
jgi:hypothetical protein